MSMRGPSLLFRYTGDITDLAADDRRALLDRSTSSDPSIRTTTASIIEQVRRDGDAALRRFAEQFDGVRLDAFEVPQAVRREALEALEPSLRTSLERAADQIRRAHSAFAPSPAEVSTMPGVTIVRRPDPLARAGVYAPGGRAAYPSSVLMGAIPARVAGVSEVVLCSPPDTSGAPSSVVLAAAEIAEVDRVFALGGAGAIAAMALGTESVPRVDRIVGPGNAYVAEAKLQLCGYVGIDSPAGPSELLVIADDTCDPRRVIAEAVAQAEHAPDASVVIVNVGEPTPAAWSDAIVSTFLPARRRDVVAEALTSRGGWLTAATIDEAIAFANSYAPEHLLVVTRDAAAVASRVRNAGTVFVGERSSVAFGDYMSGANHVLPTGGLARSYSGLSTSDFVRWTTIQTITTDAARSLSPDVARLAEAEGLPGHAFAARVAGDLT